MDLEKHNGSTTPFITLDACDGIRAESVVLALESASNGDESVWSQLIICLLYTSDAADE